MYIRTYVLVAPEAEAPHNSEGSKVRRSRYAAASSPPGSFSLSCDVMQ